jgi:RimJ/RimL family protein N-acetyltransferase
VGAVRLNRPADTLHLRLLPLEEVRLMLAGRPTAEMRAAWHPEYPLADTLEGLTWLVAAYEALGRPDLGSPWWSYQLMVDGQAVGDIGFHGPLDDQQQVTIGYQVVPSEQRRGLATAACAMLIELAWAAGARRLLANTDADNVASQRVLRRNGFRTEDGRSFLIDRPTSLAARAGARSARATIRP